MINNKAFGFEVEDIISRKNYSFIKTKDSVDMYNTSRGINNQYVMSLREQEFRNAGGEGDYSVEKHYEFLYEKSIKNNEYNIYFLGWVNENFNPLEE